MERRKELRSLLRTTVQVETGSNALVFSPSVLAFPAGTSPWPNCTEAPWDVWFTGVISLGVQGGTYQE